MPNSFETFRVNSRGRTGSGGTPSEPRLFPKALGIFQVVGKSTRLHAARSALVFVAGEVPSETIWNGDVPPVVAIKTVASIHAAGLMVDRVHLESLLSAGRKKTPPSPIETFPTPAGTIWHDVRMVVTETELSITAKGKTRQYTFQGGGIRREAEEERA